MECVQLASAVAGWRGRNGRRGAGFSSQSRKREQAPAIQTLAREAEPSAPQIRPRL